MAVMIMVSGWMDEDEDDKRTFGVLPEQMDLKVRNVSYNFWSFFSFIMRIWCSVAYLL